MALGVEGMKDCGLERWLWPLSKRVREDIFPVIEADRVGYEIL